MLLIIIDQAIIGIPSSGIIHTIGNSQILENQDIVRTFEIFRTSWWVLLGLCTIWG